MLFRLFKVVPLSQLDYVSGTQDKYGCHLNYFILVGFSTYANIFQQRKSQRRLLSFNQKYGLNLL